jgi:hypothetical protein
VARLCVSRPDCACGSVGKVALVSAVVSLVVVTPLRSAHASMLVGASGHYGELWSARGSSYGDLCLLARQFYPVVLEVPNVNFES